MLMNHKKLNSVFIMLQGLHPSCILALYVYTCIGYNRHCYKSTILLLIVNTYSSSLCIIK